MDMTVRDFVESLGGYRAASPRLGISPTTLHTHVSAGILPSKLYKALCDLAREEGVPPPDYSLFSFTPLVLDKKRETPNGKAA